MTQAVEIPRRISIVGATGTGKTALSIKLALQDRRFELLSCDSMAVYRHMDLGTAKPRPEELGDLNYRLINLVEPTEEFSIAQFQHFAQEAQGNIAPGSIALYVGGSGLYHKAVFDRLTVPPTDWLVRRRIEQELVEMGSQDLYGRLIELDPLAAEKIEPTNSRRLVRALEVIEITKVPFSSFGFGITECPPESGLLFGLEVDARRLETAIAVRVDLLHQLGWVDECRALLEMGPLSRTASFAIGYREIFSYLKRETSLDEAIQQTIGRTRKFARRQRSWFGRDGRVKWFVDPSALGDALLVAIDQP